MKTKTIVLVRHGQYHPQSNDSAKKDSAKKSSPEKLTALGRKQAKFAARRLREYTKSKKDAKILISRITHSTMPRAVETAKIIAETLIYKGQLHSCALLRECVPDFPEDRRKKSGHTDAEKLARDLKQVQRAYKKHFKSPRGKDSIEVIVCHGNVIRYFITQILGIDHLKWTKMAIQQGGISIVELRSAGSNRQVLVSHNEVGHIPASMRTFL